MHNIHQLPAGSKLIAPTYLQPILRMELTKHSLGSIGLRMLSLQSYLGTLTDIESPPSIQVLFSYLHIAKALQPQLHIYQQAVLSTPFLMACNAVIDDLKQWQIPLEHLPQKDVGQQELYQIIQALYPLQSDGDTNASAYTAIGAQDCSSLYIYPAYHDVFEEHVIQALIQQGAHVLPRLKECQHKAFYHAVNKRQEIEACAQHIIRHDLDAQDIHITLADSSYQELLQHVFHRYQIPQTILHTTNASIMTLRCISLLQYYVKPDAATLLDCLHNGLFQVEQHYALQQYMELFDHDIKYPCAHLRDVKEIGHILNPTDFEQLCKLEERAESARQEILPCLAKITDTSSFEALFLAILAQLKQSIVHREVEQPIYLKLRETLKTMYPFINDKEDIMFAISLLRNVTQHVSPQSISGALVGGLTHGVPGRKHHFLLGCTQGAYPAFQPKVGIFDERYYALLPYPSMEERNQLHTTQLMDLLQVSPYLYASFPLGTYDGKSQEAALEIEQFFSLPPQPYPLQSSYVPYPTAFTLLPKTAERLFVHQDKIQGSISAFERYIKCPFSYFLRYGLSLREPMRYGFTDSYIGTFSHYILETLLARYGKEYTKDITKSVEHLLHQEMDCMKHVFVNRTAQFAITEQRLLTSITQTLKRLQEFETHSQLTPFQQEAEFYYDIPLSQQRNITLHGFIDRIDTQGNLACIFDYKSSPKALSETNVFAALQLQLLTYAIVVRHTMHKDVLGTYYISLKNENITQPAGRLSRRKPVTYTPIDAEDCSSRSQKTHRMNGWTMREDIALADDNGTHIMGIRQNKDGIIKATKTYDLQVIEDAFRTIYQKIGNDICQGQIACEPNEDACTYCVYGDICRFKGAFRTKPQIVEIDKEQLYGKGGVLDANME